MLVASAEQAALDLGARGAPAADRARPLEAAALARTIAELREAGSLHVSLAPRLLARRLDEFY